MSKQLTMSEWAPASWVTLAKALYTRMLRSAATIAGIGLRSSPPRKQQKTAASSSKILASSACDDPREATAARAMHAMSTNPPAVSDHTLVDADCALIHLHNSCVSPSDSVMRRKQGSH